MTLEEMIALKKKQEESKNENKVEEQKNVMTQGSEDIKQQEETQNFEKQENKTEENTMDVSNVDISKFEGSVSSKFVKPLFQEDVYNAVIKSIDLKTGLKDFTTGELISKFLWTFELVSDSSNNAVTEDANGKSLNKTPVLSIFTNIAWGMKSTNYKLYTKITGKVPSENEKYNILECIGKKCRINVNTKTTKEGLPYSRIEGVMAAKN